MAAERRKWQESLRDSCDSEKTTKKAKINILEERVYKQQHGKLVLKEKKIYSNKNEDHTDEEQLSDSMSIEQKNSTSPHQKANEIENLTPTFRKPDKYLAATADFLKEISPKSEANRCLDDKHIDQMIDIQTDDSYSNITLNNTANNLNEEASDKFTISIEELNNNDLELNNTYITEETNTIPQKVSPIQCISSEGIGEDIIEIECNSPNWASFKSCEVQVTIERNSETSIESNDKKKLDTNKKKSKTCLRRSKRKLNFNKSYLDFIDYDSDSLLLNEAFPSEESSLDVSFNETTTSSSESEKKISEKDKKKKKKLKKKTKKQKKTVEKDHQLPLEKSKSKADIKKENREKKRIGLSYVNTKGETVEGKYVKPNPCAGVNCGNDCCSVSEERRLNIFNHFWGLGSYQRRRDWIGQFALRKSVKRPSKSAEANKSQTYEYYINEGEGRRKVCQKFLIATLDVTQRFILYTLDTMVDGFTKENQRGIAGGHNKTSVDVIQEAKDFIQELPLLPSHYCRKDTTRLYLPVEFKNISNLHRIYLAHGDGTKMSLKVFSNWFRKTFNIGFHVPKKDKCPLCASSKSFDVKTQEEMDKLQKHEAEKEESYKRFIFHQKLHKKDKGTICASFDLQKVLNTPYGESMTLYYSRKIAVYNFTIYESDTQLGICNLWTETDAKRGANEIGTCLLEYIIKNVNKRGNVKQIILYCDSAFGQNKNKTILAMLRYALSISDNIDTIQINYLVPGHTYMPVDSMHATIENSVKNSIVWAPSQWPTVIQFSRKNPKPYTVNVLNGEDFSGFEDIVENTFKKNQNIQISKISIVTFRKKHPDKMFVKTSMMPDAETTEIKLSALSNTSPKNKLYRSKLPICSKKYADLKKLVEKLIIPKRFAQEYLDFKNNAKVKDCLPDTDVEDDC